MESIRQLADELYREKVLRARAMSPEQKLLAGPDLFDLSCRIMADGIRSQFPELDEEGVLDAVRQRLAILRLRGERRDEQ